MQMLDGNSKCMTNLSRNVILQNYTPALILNNIRSILYYLPIYDGMCGQYNLASMKGSNNKHDTEVLTLLGILLRSGFPYTLSIIEVWGWAYPLYCIEHSYQRPYIREAIHSALNL